MKLPNSHLVLLWHWDDQETFVSLKKIRKVNQNLSSVQINVWWSQNKQSTLKFQPEVLWTNLGTKATWPSLVSFLKTQYNSQNFLLHIQTFNQHQPTFPKVSCSYLNIKEKGKSSKKHGKGEKIWNYSFPHYYYIKLTTTW